MKREALTQKLMVVGVDGMDPRLSKKYVNEGKMPNLKKIMEMGCQREDLVMLGSQPTVTPPQWTTLATGANPVVHGITQFNRIVPGLLTQQGYSLDSRLSKAEPVWNCTVEAGKKTMVLHWPGGAWPPTSSSENLYVFDGSAPGSLASAAFQVDGELLVAANESVEKFTIVNRNTGDVSAPCVINKLPDSAFDLDAAADIGSQLKYASMMTDEFSSGLQSQGVETINIIYEETDGCAPTKGGFSNLMSTVVSPITEATGWAAAPAGAKEFALATSKSLVRRVGLILQNENGVYDHVEIYKNKKSTTPIATLPVGKMVYNIIDDAIFEDKTYTANRHMKLINLAEDGSELKMFVSCAMDMNDDKVIHPKRMQKSIVENVGPFPPQSCIYTQDKDLQDCQLEVWDEIVEWYIRMFHYMIENEDIEVIFSHLHSIDLQEHTFIHYMKNLGFNEHPEEQYAFWMERLYLQVDRYLGALMHYIDEGWTFMITSDHAQVAPSYIPPHIGDMQGINCRLMEQLGYTVMKKDENGNSIKKIDWSKTRAIASQGNDIYINLKGREPNGIVDPEDKYELEEQIISDLYSYRHPDSGKRVIALALHNKDAVLLGYGGPTAGDVCFWVAEGYNYDHTDSLSTTWGEGDTSSSPIFAAAGPGIKKGETTDRIIRQVDLAPTVAWLLGTRMPAQCEGAPIYQILEEEF